MEPRGPHYAGGPIKGGLMENMPDLPGKKQIEKYDKNELLTAIKKIPEDVKTLKEITDQASLTRCEKALDVIGRLIKAFLGIFNPIKDAQYKAYKLTMATIKETTGPLYAADRAVKAMIGDYDLKIMKEKEEKERLAREEKEEVERKAAEIIKKAKEETEQQAAELIIDGKEDQAAEVIEEAKEGAEQQAAEVIEEAKEEAIEQEIPEIMAQEEKRTTFVRMDYSYEVTDINELPMWAKLPDGSRVNLVIRKLNAEGLNNFTNKWGNNPDRPEIPGLFIHSKPAVIRKRGK